MDKTILSIKNIYLELNKTTRHLLKISVIIYLCLVSAAIFSHFQSSFELLILQDDFLQTAKSVISTGIFGAVLIEYIHKK